MNIVVGEILSFIGLLGSIFMTINISTDHHYTYTFPLTGHEMAMLFFLFLFAVMLFGGIVMIIFSFIKKNNQDKLNQLIQMEDKNTKKGVCPKCGLNLAEDVHVCPRCGTHQEGR